MRVAKQIATGVASFLATNLARLCGDRRGSIAVFLGLAIIPLVGAIGIGVDTARGFLVRSRLSQALDSAALAGGRVMFENYRDQDVAMYFTSNFPNGYLGATVGTPVITDDGAKKEFLTVTAEATLPSTFMRIFGQNTITVRASATINRVNRGMELVLVLDNTYSMNSNNKMTTLKTAANDLLDILFGEEDTANQLSVSVVPFVTMVNIGETRESWTTPRPSTAVSISSLTRSSAVGGDSSLTNTDNPRTYRACATTSSNHGFNDGQMVDITNAVPTMYNGRRQIRTTNVTGCTSGSNKFWYIMDNGGSGSNPTTPATPAPSTSITAQLPPEAFAAGTGYTATNARWKGCVEQRRDDPNDPYDVINADVAPTVRPFYKAFNPSTVGGPSFQPTGSGTSITGLRWYDSSNLRMRYQCTTRTSTTTSTSPDEGGSNDCDNNWASGSTNENGNSTSPQNNRGPNKGCALEVLPLQPSRQAVSDKVALMQPWNGGGTNIPVGLAWGWRMLSPNYRGLWGGPTPATQPIDYNTALVDKVVVLLSDGKNQVLEGGLPGCTGSHGSYGCAPTESEYTGYGRLTGGGLNATSTTGAETESNSRVAAMCAQMKAAPRNIIIYTIMLEEPDPAISAVFQACATKPEYYFQATSGDLTSVFKKIANQLSNLRLSQ